MRRVIAPWLAFRIHEHDDGLKVATIPWWKALSSHAKEAEVWREQAKKKWKQLQCHPNFHHSCLALRLEYSCPFLLIQIVFSWALQGTVGISVRIRCMLKTLHQVSIFRDFHNIFEFIFGQPFQSTDSTDSFDMNRRKYSLCNATKTELSIWVRIHVK